MIGGILAIAIGLGAISLGAKGFGRQGLPFTSNKRLTGTGAKIAGVVCILIGLAFLAAGVVALIPRTR